MLSFRDHVRKPVGGGGGVTPMLTWTFVIWDWALAALVELGSKWMKSDAFNNFYV